MKETQKEEEIIVPEQEVEKTKQSLPKAPFSFGYTIMKYQGIWYTENLIPNVLAFQRHFHARDTDIIICGHPKTGTTWLKSLLFSVVNRATSNEPLLSKHPHELVYSLETDVYSNAFLYPRPCHLHELPVPRLLSTHLPYKSLPDSIKASECRILYMCRNPLDTLVSYYYFYINAMRKYYSKDVLKMIMRLFYRTPSMEDFFDAFCEEMIPLGPFFDHVLEYWNASLERPGKVLFLKYEDLKEDPTLHLKRLAEFVGVPFTSQEESEGVVDDIIQMCSIKSMKELEVNKNGVINEFFEKKSYFRKGEVGDWTNHFTPPMVERMKKIMDHKLQGTGLSFKLR